MAKSEISNGSGRDMSGRRPTMGDLAALAGVSKITISRALNDSPLVRAAVREQIQQLASAHGYRLNTAARNLRLRRNHSITAAIEMMPSADRPMSDPILLAALGGLLQVATSAGYRVILTTLAQLLQSRSADSDGIILLGQGTDPDAVRRVRALDLPLVVWGTPRDSDGDWLTIGSDNRAGGRLIGEHLASLGRRRILFLGDPTHPEIADRLDAIRKASGAEVEVQPCDFGIGPGSVAMKAALARGWRGDAVAAASDAIALGAQTALQEAGITVPADIAMTGYDGIPASAVAAVPLTTVRQDWERAGELVGAKLLQWLDNGRPEAELLPVELIIRASTTGA
ncbi:LacI family DNA-binding transcriptional regulator [Sphingomonas sp.]|uniref:LacI family DNA-binding transcriptional regulator n=1 Tax=Sphingomonas sp. TaxID=28214 RepID=UPI003D6CA7A6